MTLAIFTVQFKTLSAALAALISSAMAFHASARSGLSAIAWRAMLLDNLAPHANDRDPARRLKIG